MLLDLIPRSVGEPFTQNHLAQLVVLTLALGIGLVKIRDSQKARGETSFQVVSDLLTIGFELLMKVLLWVVALAPIAVFGIVAASVGHKEGMSIFQSLIWLIVVVALGLLIQVAWYLLQMALFARMSPTRFLSGSLNVMANTFSTASTAATIPITLRARTARHLATVQPVDGVHRDEFQQRRDAHSTRRPPCCSSPSPSDSSCPSPTRS